MISTRWPARLLVAFIVAGSLASCSDTTNSPAPAAPTGPTASTGQTQRLTFDADTAVPGAAFDGSWTVRAEGGTTSVPNALCQTGTATFPAIALTAENYRDGMATVRFKAISGREDQAAGIIFRVVDGDNYYVLRANALEGNANFYKYVNGNRSTLQESSATVTAGSWHELAVDFTGATMTSSLDGKQLGNTTDNTFVTGRVGLWTKADSHTCFDDLTATAR